MEKNNSEKVALAILLFLIDFVITGFVTCYLWNNTMARVLGATTITYWQGWALSLLVSYFKPKSWGREADTINDLGKDIIYTLICALMMWALVAFAGI